MPIGLATILVAAAIQPVLVRGATVPVRFAITKSIERNGCPVPPALRDHAITVTRYADSAIVVIDDGNGRFRGPIDSAGAFRTEVRSGELADGSRLTARLVGIAGPREFRAVLEAERFAVGSATATCAYGIRWTGAPLETNDPELVGPGTISTGSVYRGTFTPDGDTLYFFRKTGAGEQYRLFKSARRNGEWTLPERVTLGGDFSDTYPTISADGRRMVFASYRPAPDAARFPPQAYLWMVERDAARWGAPRFLMDANRPQRYHSQPRILRNGALEFVIQTPDYRAKTMMSARATRAGFAVADTLALWRDWQRRVPAGQHLFDLTVAPDASYALLSFGARPEASMPPGPADLWITRRRGADWAAPVPLGGGVNTSGVENFPFWSPSGRDLYFVRDFATLHRIPIATATIGSTDSLARRAYLGVTVRADSSGAVVVETVRPGSTAAALGLAPGDRVDAIDDTPPSGVAALPAAVAVRRAGDTIALRVTRAGRGVLNLRGALRPLPYETLRGAVVEYAAAVSPHGYRVRTILLVPDTAARVPAVLYLPGLGCTALDRPFPVDGDAQVRLWHGIVRAGLAVMKVEKPGAGDSEGPRCSEIGFVEERDAFRAALQALRANPRVDPSRIVLFGFSMGGALAPFIADSTIAGVAVYGTIARNFFEYMVENGRRQMPRERRGAVADEDWSRRTTEALARILFDQRTPADVWRAHPSLAGYPPVSDSTHLHGRHARYFHELQRANLVDAWSRVRAPVLAMHGEFDWVSSEDDHRLLARLTGGEFRSLPGLDHGLTRHASLEASYAAYTRGTPSDAALETFVDWMRGINTRTTRSLR